MERMTAKKTICLLAGLVTLAFLPVLLQAQMIPFAFIQKQTTAGAGSATVWDTTITNSGITYSNSDATATMSGSTTKHSVGSTNKKTGGGKWYAEITMNNDGGSGKNYWGVAFDTIAFTEEPKNSDSWTMRTNDKAAYYDGSLGKTGTLFGATSGAILQIAVDTNTSKGDIWWGVNGTWDNSGDPGAGTNPNVTGETKLQNPSGNLLILVNLHGSNSQFTINDALIYPIPSGFAHWK